ncbi:DNA repair protein rad2 [Cadophora gregata]|uniref:DNA repair protein rad2 n=1 Tax=Cadophora gregata TaxID=51156 RepID=UPI0026DADFB3|nr:DNA repair protein rad2 [Cadophora gregata]KAK0122033.1 DNA repair protein rad2 [Cadophora gregata]
MGVTGLWPILAPSARPTPLPTLNEKRLAVDASIWIYQFLKAVRDKEGNALRNSHVVGFFRRICKLLFFGIRPVFVFDGGAPILKRQTIQGRKRRREGRREDAVRTAGKLLAVQMKRRGEEEEEKRKREVRREKERGGRPAIQDEEEAIPEGADLVYVGEMGMSTAERNKNRTFRKTDAYHLPDLTNGIEGMGQPNDPRIMSAEDLEEYARQFHNGEDVNLYDFSKIDFNGEFFLSLPAGDRYNILNAARLRSRLRMGHSKEQLDGMFPDRMAFSRFQIDRVRERNELTQRLMNLNGMNDLPGVGGGRIAGERGREYVLVKNEGAEGGYALGVVSTDKGVGGKDKPIDIDAIPQKFKDDSESEDEFEDVPVEGLNRLPQPSTRNMLNLTYTEFRAQELAERRKRFYAHKRRKVAAHSRESSEEIPLSQHSRTLAPSHDPDSLFIDQNPAAELSCEKGPAFDEEEEDLNRAIALSLQKDGKEAESDEDDHLNRAIAMSLQKNHGPESEPDEEMDFEDVPLPEYEQKPAAESAKPISGSSGGIIAHIVNNRANAAMPKRKAVPADVDTDSDSDMDMKAALAKARRQKAPERRNQPAPVTLNKKNPFDGPLPFESLGSIFFKKSKPAENHESGNASRDGEDMAGGFDCESEENAPRELPPWLAGGDIRNQVELQKERDRELNAEDREQADEEERMYRKAYGPIQIDSSDEDSDIEVVEAPEPKKSYENLELRVDVAESRQASSPKNAGEIWVATIPDHAAPETFGEVAEAIRAEPPMPVLPDNRQPSVEAISQDMEAEELEWSESHYGETSTLRDVLDAEQPPERTDISPSMSASPEFEDVEMLVPEVADRNSPPLARSQSPFNDTEVLGTLPAQLSQDDSFAIRERTEIDAEFDDFSDPEDEELLAQLAVEAETHAQFANSLNNRTEQETQATFEQELKALRNQQKKDRRDADEVTQVMITECQALLRLFGIPYITAPMEAEAQCAELVRLGLVDGVVTDDCDIFLFGGTRVYKNMFNSNKFVECYLSTDIEKELSLSRDQLIAIAHLLGSDYTEGLPGVGPVTAVEILSEFPASTGLQEFKEWWSTVQINGPPINNEPTTFRKKFRRAQGTKLFLPPTFPSPAVTEAYLKPDVDSNPDAFEWGVPDLDRLREFLMATIGWTQERTDEVLVPVIRDMNRREQEGTQANITRYFDGAVGTGVNTGGGGGDRVTSKRMKDAVGKLRAKKKNLHKEKDNPLGKTFAEVGQEWAKKNDLGWTEREQAKLWGKGEKRREKKGRGRKRTAVDLEEEDGQDDGAD